MRGLALLLLAAPSFAATVAKKASEISQDITVRSRAAVVGLQVAPPSASKPVIDEVLKSLSLGRGTRQAAAERIRTGGDLARFLRPFPEPPFLALSPANILAVYDEWLFEVVDSEGEIAWKTDGVGTLNEKIDWDGGGPNGQLAVVAGRSYHYRFTGRRAGRAFVIESDPVPIKSFTHREYAGETRLEVVISEIFADGEAKVSKDAEKWMDAFASRLRTAEPRLDGTYRLELAAKDLRSPLTVKRQVAVMKAMAKALLVAPDKVVVSPMPALRGEALAALLPPAKGPSLRIE